jgi:hypothetical protein
MIQSIDKNTIFKNRYCVFMSFPFLLFQQLLVGIPAGLFVKKQSVQSTPAQRDRAQQWQTRKKTGESGNQKLQCKMPRKQDSSFLSSLKHKKHPFPKNRKRAPKI